MGGHQYFFTIGLDNPSAIKGLVEAWIIATTQYVAQLRRHHDIHLPQFGKKGYGGSDTYGVGPQEFLSAMCMFTNHYPHLIFTVCHTYSDNTHLQIYTIQGEDILRESFFTTESVPLEHDIPFAINPKSLAVQHCINGIFTPGQTIDLKEPSLTS